MRKRRIPGAEVVERDGEAFIAQSAQRLADRVLILQQARLRHFELDPRRIAAHAAYNLQHVRRQIIAVELPRRQIDRYPQRQPGAAPEGTLSRRGAQRPITERVNEPGLLRQWNEYSGRHGAVHRVVPSQQCFGADDCTVADSHYGVIDQAEGVFLQRHSQRAFQRVLLQPPVGELRIEKLVRVAAQLLRAVHRDVGML